MLRLERIIQKLFGLLGIVLVVIALCVTTWTNSVYAQPRGETLPDEVILGFNPAENAQSLQASADQLAQALSERIHVPVRAFVALDYTALVEAMRAGQVHFGWLTPAPLVLAENLFNVQIVLTQVRRGSPTYYSALVVRADSSIRNVDDLQGKSVAWVDPQSTSGYIIPRYLLIQRGLDPMRFFRQQTFAGGHDSAVFAVQNGQVDVAAVWADPPGQRTGAWTRFSRAGSPALRPILYSPPVPSDAVAVHPSFMQEHPMLVRTVKEALISIGQTEQGRTVLLRLNHTDGFVAADPSQYALVRAAFRASRSSSSVEFEKARDVQIFVGICFLALVLALPLWKSRKNLEKVRMYSAWTLLLLALVWSTVSAKLSLFPLWTGRGQMFSFLRSMVPMNRAVIPAVIESAIVTIQLALVGTLLAVPIALVLGFVAARNVVQNPIVRMIVRFLLNLNRSVDTLILALVLVSAVGLGPLPGVVALSIHSVGALAKLFYEAIETLDPGPADAMRAVGATPLQVLRWGIWPQFVPHFISIVLFRFELNVRVSTVLGLVGAGGLGFLLMTYMRGAEYAKVTVVIVAIVVLVMALDAISSRLRKQTQ